MTSLKKAIWLKPLNIILMRLRWTQTTQFFSQTDLQLTPICKKWDKSLRDADKAIKLNSSWEKGYWRKGNAHFELGQFDEATAAYKQASDLEPSNQTYKELYQKAKKATLKGKSEGEILKMQGNEEFKKGNIETAIKIYTSALAECDDDEKGKAVKADLYCNRAACYHQLYDPKKTAEDLPPL